MTTSKTNNNQMCVWDFTIPNDNIKKEVLIEKLNKHCKDWTFQGEKGKTGYLHWQGRLSLKVKLRLTEIVRMFYNMLLP